MASNFKSPIQGNVFKQFLHLIIKWAYRCRNRKIIFPESHGKSSVGFLNNKDDFSSSWYKNFIRLTFPLIYGLLACTSACTVHTCQQFSICTGEKLFCPRPAAGTQRSNGRGRSYTGTAPTVGHGPTRGKEDVLLTIGKVPDPAGKKSPATRSESSPMIVNDIFFFVHRYPLQSYDPTSLIRIRGLIFLSHGSLFFKLVRLGLNVDNQLK